MNWNEHQNSATLNPYEKIMAVAEKEPRKMTYGEYLAWPSEQRWELIDGELFDMTPAPTFKHQTIVLNFAIALKQVLKQKPCTIGIAPTDIVFSEYDVVQPDVFVVCARARITDENIEGAPELIVEVLSPSTAIKDRREKKNLYERFNVLEYILVYPDLAIVERYSLSDGKYTMPESFNWDEEMELRIFDNIMIKLWEVFGKEIKA